MISASIALLLFILGRNVLGLPSQRPSLLHDHSAHATLGAVSSMDARCSSVGIDILKIGGNAADADTWAVATQFCLGVIGLHLTGIGGGGFVTVRKPHGGYDFIDFRETAPAASFETMFDNDANASLYGGLASGVPGEVKGLHHLHAEYGRLPWAQLVEPAIKLAHGGFVIGEDLNFYMDAILNDSLFLSPAWAPDFAPSGTRLRNGDLLTRRRYSKVLSAIAEHGPNAFYGGSIAEATINAIKRTGGIMTLDDLLEYRVAVRKPRSTRYRDYRLTSGGAPCGGIVVLNILNTLRGYTDAGSPLAINLTTHRLDEAIRFAYGARTKLGDPAFLHTLDEYEQAMLSNDTANVIRSKIRDNETQPVSAYDPEGLEILETPGTSHVSVADSSGMAVSLTSTINLLFGSQVMVPETGIILNNEMDDFSVKNSTNAFGFAPSAANYIKPGKRPLSSMSPVIVEYLSNNTLYLVTGAAGGSRIITATVQSLWNVLDRGMSPRQAIEEPRFHDQLIPNEMMFEHTYSNATIAFLQGRGHAVSWLDHGSDLQIIRRLPNGTFEAASENRQHDSGGFAV
ncbi:gamma-glutamyltransferase [Coniochaeta ligniaria NRRL 30616]|uniref:Glutathione hydrolase n=1 Tax=Coniochaeta ligniaria NRRL 30616 TaxID=1408157 RepID=A0A1J7ISP8_9PEZI|nr:gamma-glutamyltransferase [Coniochaeta ligniaria NRRL 30616]